MKTAVQPLVVVVFHELEQSEKVTVMCSHISSLIVSAYIVQTANLTHTKLQILLTCPMRNAQISDVTDIKKSKVLCEF